MVFTGGKSYFGYLPKLLRGHISMEVKKVFLETDSEEYCIRYMLLDYEGNPVVPVIRYLKYLDDIGRKENTLRSYSYHLKDFFLFLLQNELTYKDVTIDVIRRFVGWLRKPNRSVKITELPTNQRKNNHTQNTRILSNSSINRIVNTVIGFYDYLYLLEDYDDEIKNVAYKKVSSKNRHFKSFLHHIKKDNKINRGIFSLPVPKQTIKTLTQEQVKLIISSCTNIRDCLLLRILYETGMRIDEALNLAFEHFDIASGIVHVSKSKTTAGEGRTVYVTSDTMNIFQEYIYELMNGNIDSNYVFITLKGPNIGRKLKYMTAYAMINTIKKKTGIYFSPHMFRHTFATELIENDANTKAVQELLGHKHVQTTLNTYTHFSKDKIRKEYEKRFAKE